MRLSQFTGSLLLVLVCAVASAQTPFRISENGTKQTLQYNLNLTGNVSCANNSGAKRTDCALTGIVADTPLSGAGTSASHLVCPTCLSGSASSAGDMFYSTSGGSGMSRLAPVATGSLLGSQGTSSGPAWVTSITNFTLVTPNISSATASADTAIINRSAADTHGTTISAQITLENTTAATAANQKRSGAISFLGRGWKTSATAGSQTTGFVIDMLPIQATTNPSSSLVFSSITNGGTATPRFNFVWDSVNSNARIYGASTTAAFIQLNSGDLRLFGGSGSSQGIRFESNNFFPEGAGQINIGTGSFPFASNQARQFVSNNTARPSCSVGAGAGSGATCSLAANSTQNAGRVIVNTGTSPTAGSTIVTLTNLTVDAAIFCTFVPGDANTGVDAASVGAYHVTDGSGSTMGTIVSSASVTGLDASSTYVWQYTCFESTSI